MLEKCHMMLPQIQWLHAVFLLVAVRDLRARVSSRDKWSLCSLPIHPSTPSPTHLPTHPPTPWTVNPAQHIISSLMDTDFMSSKWIPKNENLNFLQKWSLNVLPFDLDHSSLPFLSIDLDIKWPSKFHMLKALCPCMVLLGGSGNVQRSLEGS